MIPFRHIAFVTGNYPTRKRQSSGVFVRQLVEAVAQHGVRCSVIQPWPLHDWLRESLRQEPPSSARADGIGVYRPLTLSLSNKQFGRWNSSSLTNRDFTRAVVRAIDRLPDVPDAIYGHFLFSAGAAAVQAGNRIGRPSFVAVGESFAVGQSALWSLRGVGLPAARKLFGDARGFVAVSTLLKAQLTRDLLIPEAKVSVFPNGIDLRLFRQRDRAAMRKKFALPPTTFLVAFVGAFDERKGVRRVAAALEGMPDTAGVYIGQGPLEPKGTQVAFCGRLPHELVAELLAACDVFVLPSEAEGSSNATIEAMACGLPVIVSKGEYNDDIVNEQVALRVSPLDVAALRSAIDVLRCDVERRGRMGAAARCLAGKFDIKARARGILNWMAELRAPGAPC